MGAINVRLGILRTARGLSRQRLAALADLHLDIIVALERGPSEGIQFSTLVKLCQALGCQPGDLLELDADAEVVPVLGGPDEDALILARLTASGWPGLVEEADVEETPEGTPELVVASQTA